MQRVLGSNPSGAQRKDFYMKLDKSYFVNIFKPQVFELTPEDCDSEEEFIDIVSNEVWNLDEWTPEGIMMLKHFIFKAVTKDVPKDYDIDRNYLKSLIKKKVKSWQV
jgi:hypothetical protein